MKKYKIEASETYHYEFIVDADTKEQAFDTATERIDGDCNDYVVGSFFEITSTEEIT